jgi:hypothetical protein
MACRQAYGASPEVFEFLNPWSSAYALETDVSLLNVVANNLDNARHSVKNKVGAVEVTCNRCGLVQQSIEQSEWVLMHGCSSMFVILLFSGGKSYTKMHEPFIQAH